MLSHAHSTNVISGISGSIHQCNGVHTVVQRSSVWLLLLARINEIPSIYPSPKKDIIDRTTRGCTASGKPKMKWMINVTSRTRLSIEGAIRAAGAEKNGRTLSVMQPILKSRMIEDRTEKFPIDKLVRQSKLSS